MFGIVPRSALKLSGGNMRHVLVSVINSRESMCVVIAGQHTRSRSMVLSSKCQPRSRASTSRSSSAVSARCSDACISWLSTPAACSAAVPGACVSSSNPWISVSDHEVTARRPASASQQQYAVQCGGSRVKHHRISLARCHAVLCRNVTCFWSSRGHDLAADSRWSGSCQFVSHSDAPLHAA